MFVKFREGTVMAGKEDEFFQKINEVSIPAYEAMKGCKGCKLLLDRKSLKAVFISYWETEADMHASEENVGFRKQLDDVRQPPTSSFYEVIV
ncbi:MAG: antibiotic biosynthesis monooxygenase [Pseudomonadota bacterium]